MLKHKTQGRFRAQKTFFFLQNLVFAFFSPILWEELS